ncbi:MAG: ATP-binding protein [Oscillospiraceae bacterium]|nr:ATP-binding protein [Oscillospiraceae bacterium]
MKKLTMKAERESIPAVIDFVNRELDELGCPEKTKTQIDIAIDELYGNIASYAYGEENGEVTVAVDHDSAAGAVSISFQDEGKPFNPLESGEPDVTLSARERKVGGLGIFLVRKSMDDVRYEYRDGKNILTIRKTL